MRQVGIGLLGFGTVGAGVVEGLAKHSKLLANRVGVELVLRKIADLDLDSDRGVAVDPGIMTQDAHSVVRDPAVDVVVELIGGCGAARDLMLEALEIGKPVVTANKKLLAEHGREVFGIAAEKGTDLYFGASVGGGIPIIRALRDGLVANEIHGVYGILNGTCNYILTRMERDGLSFEAALGDAGREGYAEADPSLDIDGYDSAHKAAILAALSYGGAIPMESIPVEGIRGIAGMDVAFARDFGYRIKLLAVIQRIGEAVQVRVQPMLVPLEHMLASVNDVFNAVMVRGDFCDDTLFYGRGAGRFPTAGTVIGDIADAAVDLVSKGGPSRGKPSRFDGELPIFPLDDLRSCYYIRLSVLDRPGSFGALAAALGANGVSISSVMQKESRQTDRFVPVVVLTHESREKSVKDSIQAIREMDVVDECPVRMPILDS